MDAAQQAHHARVIEPRKRAGTKRRREIFYATFRFLLGVICFVLALTLVTRENTLQEVSTFSGVSLLILFYLTATKRA